MKRPISPTNQKVKRFKTVLGLPIVVNHEGQNKKLEELNKINSEFSQSSSHSLQNKKPEELNETYSEFSHSSSLSLQNNLVSIKNDAFSHLQDIEVTVII